MSPQHTRRNRWAKTPERHAFYGRPIPGDPGRPASTASSGRDSRKQRSVWASAGIALLWLIIGCPGRAADVVPLFPLQVQRALELEDWPTVLKGLAADPLTNVIPRLAVVRALFETGRLPDELFAWIRQSGPELFSTGDLKQHAGSAYIAETLLQLGHLNSAERLAFNSLEMEGTTPAVLRTLVRLHLVKGQTNAARIFLNHLQTFPEQRDWAAQRQADLAAGPTVTGDPALSRIRTNLVTRDGIASGLTTERLLRQALDANPHNRMAFQFLMAHQLLERRLLYAVRTLVTSPQAREGPLPRHYAEAVLLHRQLFPRIALDALLARVPPEVKTDFQGFQETVTRAAAAPESARPEAFRDYATTYWYYFYRSPAEASGVVPQTVSPASKPGDA